jgi:hypothetical protein
VVLPAMTLQPVEVMTGPHDQEGRLVFVDAQLVAVRVVPLAMRGTVEASPRCLLSFRRHPSCATIFSSLLWLLACLLFRWQLARRTLGEDLRLGQ